MQIARRIVCSQIQTRLRLLNVLVFILYVCFFLQFRQVLIGHRTTLAYFFVQDVRLFTGASVRTLPK